MGGATSSTFEPTHTASGSHDFTVSQYSQSKTAGGPGYYVKSGNFWAGGHKWFIRFYPSGDAADNADCISVYLEIADPSFPAAAEITFRCVDRTGAVMFGKTSSEAKQFNEKSSCLGFTRFVERTQLETSPCLFDDSVTVRCIVTVAKPWWSTVKIRGNATCSDTAGVSSSAEHLKNLLWLLETGEAADVTFHVDGTVFQAHRCILAAQSPVFRAELLGPMKEGSTRRIEIKDMKPVVFKALLHFMYSGSLLPVDDVAGDGLTMAQDLLAAADRYGLERLKKMYEKKLRKCINVETVMSIMAFAEQHYCCELRDECIRFLQQPGMLEQVSGTDEFKRILELLVLKN